MTLLTPDAVQDWLRVEFEVAEALENVTLRRQRRRLEGRQLPHHLIGPENRRALSVGSKLEVASDSAFLLHLIFIGNVRTNRLSEDFSPALVENYGPWHILMKIRPDTRQMKWNVDVGLLREHERWEWKNKSRLYRFLQQSHYVGPL